MKYLLKTIISLFLLIFCFTNAVYAIDLPEESLYYDIGFLWFKKAAEGKITFKKNNNDSNYTAVLEAETLGFIGFITSYRKYIYISHLKYDENLNRLISTKFERIEIVGNKIWQSATLIDYESNKINWKSSFMQKLLKETVEEMPSAPFLGEIRTTISFAASVPPSGAAAGKDYIVKGIPDKGIVNYSI